MGHTEDILKLRKRVADAVTAGLLENNIKDFYEATLLQILNEAERQRQVCVAQAESLRKQAAVADGQASGYSAIGSIVYSVINAYILQAEKAQREEQARAAEQAEKDAYKASLEINQSEQIISGETAAAVVVEEKRSRSKKTKHE